MSPASVQVREATTRDCPSLVAFNLALAAETEGLALDPKVVEGGVAAVLSSPVRGFYLIAETKGRRAGSLLVTSEWSDWRNGEYWWVQSVYVLPEFRRTGVFRSMLSFLRTEAARRKDVCSVRLYVIEGNATARDVYKELGFEETGYRVLQARVLRA